MHDYPLKRRTSGHVLADKARRVGNRSWLIFGPDRYGYAEARSPEQNFGYRPDGILHTCLPLFHGLVSCRDWRSKCAA